MSQKIKKNYPEEYLKRLKPALKSESNTKKIFNNQLLTYGKVARVKYAAGITEEQKSSWKRLTKTIGQPSQCMMGCIQIQILTTCISPEVMLGRESYTLRMMLEPWMEMFCSVY